MFLTGSILFPAPNIVASVRDCTQSVQVKRILFGKGWYRVFVIYPTTSRQTLGYCLKSSCVLFHSQSCCLTNYPKIRFSSACSAARALLTY